VQDCRARARERQRSEPSFVRLNVSDGREQSEVDLAIDYRALKPVETRYGPALDLRELGANKVLAIFARAEPRDSIDLEQLTNRFRVEELIAYQPCRGAASLAQVGLHCRHRSCAPGAVLAERVVRAAQRRRRRPPAPGGRNSAAARGQRPAVQDATD
jgi:hypothetical protein